MSSILLSISILTPGNNPYLRQCLKALADLREEIEAELVVVDTGCNTNDRAIVEEFADKVIEFAWCDDFAAARNAGLEHCQGRWFLYIDDDEVLESTKPLVEFLKSDESKKYSYASLNIKNYTDDSLENYLESTVTRLYRKRKDIKFVYPIHEGIPLSSEDRGTRLTATIGHYGYIFNSQEELQKHANRNINLLKKTLENEQSIHLACQLAHEYQIIDDYEKQVEACEIYYPLAETNRSEQAILFCGWLAGLTGLRRYADIMEKVENFARTNDSCYSVTTTVYAYACIAAYHLKAYSKVIDYLNDYLLNYEHATANIDDLATEFFTRNGLNHGYYQLVLQMGMISALVLHDDNALKLYAERIPWQDEEYIVHEDIPRVLCEAIEEGKYTAETAGILEKLLSVEQIKNEVLQYKIQSITN